jgi:hypothetical protein
MCDKILVIVLLIMSIVGCSCSGIINREFYLLSKEVQACHVNDKIVLRNTEVKTGDTLDGLNRSMPDMNVTQYGQFFPVPPPQNGYRWVLKCDLAGDQAYWFLIKNNIIIKIFHVRPINGIQIPKLVIGNGEADAGNKLESIDPIGAIILEK